MSITYDLTSSNTGCLGGLHVKLENLHKEEWDKDKLAGKIPAWLKGANQEVSENPPPLVEKDCNDHLAALISCEFAHRVHLLGVHWGIDAFKQL